MHECIFYVIMNNNHTERHQRHPKWHQPPPKSINISCIWNVTFLGLVFRHPHQQRRCSNVRLQWHMIHINTTHIQMESIQRDLMTFMYQNSLLDVSVCACYSREHQANGSEPNRARCGMYLSCEHFATHRLPMWNGNKIYEQKWYEMKWNEWYYTLYGTEFSYEISSNKHSKSIQTTQNGMKNPRFLRN